MDMVNSPSKFDPGVDFFTRLLNAPSDIFEISLYKIHIAGRKQEKSSTNSTLYTKYRVLDIQETLISYGLGKSFSLFHPTKIRTNAFLSVSPEAAYNRIPGNLDIIAERFPFLISEEPLQDLLVQFMKEYKYFFMCFHPKYVPMIPRNTLEAFLRKAPVAMTVSDTAGLEVEVIPNGQGEGEWNMTYV